MRALLRRSGGVSPSLVASAAAKPDTKPLYQRRMAHRLWAGGRVSSIRQRRQPLSKRCDLLIAEPSDHLMPKQSLSVRTMRFFLCEALRNKVAQRRRKLSRV
mmetsp:Transcript_5054/g.12393  ORF Transcript_5054/g.12393 Transcript_5054/m.12393 type:complete len:102 (-) Transcript_5054:973-1278(-)